MSKEPEKQEESKPEDSNLRPFVSRIEILDAIWTRKYVGVKKYPKECIYEAMATYYEEKSKPLQSQLSSLKKENEELKCKLSEGRALLYESFNFMEDFDTEGLREEIESFLKDK